jgi:hypothetical protein
MVAEAAGFAAASVLLIGLASGSWAAGTFPTAAPADRPRPLLVYAPAATQIAA